MEAERPAAKRARGRGRPSRAEKDAAEEREEA